MCRYREFCHFCLNKSDKVSGIDFDLKSPDAGADIYKGEIVTGGVNECRKKLLHADRRATAPDIAGNGK